MITMMRNVHKCPVKVIDLMSSTEEVEPLRERVAFIYY